MICPNCNEPTLKDDGIIPRLTCSTCHHVFDTLALEGWGLDVADLYDGLSTIKTIDPETHEPVWYSGSQRYREYQTVDEMYAGIGPMEDDKVDYGYPIGWGKA